MVEGGRSMVSHAPAGSPMKNPREEELIRLLMAGHTDSSAARRLKVSPRTITTMLRNLMDRMAVNNRFQLGVSLGRHMALAEELCRERETVEERRH
jgi:DNA-binding CsgD family transcriptional regulator